MVSYYDIRKIHIYKDYSNYIKRFELKTIKDNKMFLGIFYIDNKIEIINDSSLLIKNKIL